MNDRTPLDLEAARVRLDAERGPQYWRSLEELADTEEFRALLDREFPQGASEMTDAVGRRQFLRLMGASLALAGVTACTKQPPEKIIPYVNQPEGLVPGAPMFFATAVSLGGFATGVLVESHEGRPTKIEGNPDHPASLGATDACTQASVLDLYDPDRAQNITYLGDIRPWSDFLSAVRNAVDGRRASGGKGLRILTETVTSPTLAFQIRSLLGELPGVKWHQWEPVGRDQAKAGSLSAFGENLDVVYAVDRAKVILSLDSDLLAAGPGALRYARQFARHRKVGGASWEMNRLYVVESTVSHTGQAADHRLPLPASKIHPFALALAGALGVAGLDPELVRLDLATEAWVKGVADDLRRNEGASLVVVGNEQPAVVHALAHAINEKLGNIGQTVVLIDPVEAEPIEQAASLKELVADMAAGQVDVLVMLGGNPVHTAPADLRYADALGKVAIRVHLSQHHDETSALCHWHLPEAHALESWSDTRAFDGTVTIVQPLIAPIAGGRTAHEVVAAFGKQAGQPGYDLVRGYWRGRFEREQPAGDFELFWKKALHDGVVPQTACAPRAVAVRPQVFGPPRPPSPGPVGAIEVNFRPDPSVYDGRFANNGWLQELPETA